VRAHHGIKTATHKVAKSHGKTASASKVKRGVKRSKVKSTSARKAAGKSTTASGLRARTTHAKAHKSQSAPTRHGLKAKTRHVAAHTASTHGLSKGASHGTPGQVAHKGATKSHTHKHDTRVKAKSATSHGVKGTGGTQAPAKATHGLKKATTHAKAKTRGTSSRSAAVSCRAAWQLDLDRL
jgi:hypothetical protein